MMEQNHDPQDKTIDQVVVHSGEAGPIIEQYYDDAPLTEWERLERHPMELAITLRALQEYLPSTPQKVLDVGGGPGRYALALAEQGHQVTLLDLSRGNLNFARQQAGQRGTTIQDYVHGNALDLSRFESQSFDALLLLGPLYHLQAEQERQQAVQQAMRSLRPGGIIFAAFITRYAPFRDLAKNAPGILLEKQEHWSTALRTGIYQADQGVGFTAAYFAHPAEIKLLFEEAGAETLDLIGCESLTAFNEELVNKLTGDDWQAWVDLSYQLGKEPTLYGASNHLLYVGRKKQI